MTAKTTSPNPNISVTMFDPPSGKVRGSLSVDMATKKGDKTIAHCILTTDEPAKISLKLPATLSPDECDQAAALLTAFATKVRELDIKP